MYSIIGRAPAFVFAWFNGINMLYENSFMGMAVQVPTVLSLIGAALVICASLMLGLVERRNSLKAARAAEVEAILAHTGTAEASKPLLQRSWSK